MAQFYLGSTVRLSATFENFAGTATDPTTITVFYQAPTDEAVTTAVFASSGTGGWTKTSTGVYSFDVEVDEAGKWTFAFEGTGTVDVYQPSTFTVLPRPAG